MKTVKGELKKLQMEVKSKKHGIEEVHEEICPHILWECQFCGRIQVTPFQKKFRGLDEFSCEDCGNASTVEYKIEEEFRAV